MTIAHAVESEMHCGPHMCSQMSQSSFLGVCREKGALDSSRTELLGVV